MPLLPISTDGDVSVVRRRCFVEDVAMLLIALVLGMWCSLPETEQTDVDLLTSRGFNDPQLTA